MSGRLLRSLVEERAARLARAEMLTDEAGARVSFGNSATVPRE
jgi:hypothetical protein